jgi:hypothetical protein
MIRIGLDESFSYCSFMKGKAKFSEHGGTSGVWEVWAGLDDQ